MYIGVGALILIVILLIIFVFYADREAERWTSRSDSNWSSGPGCSNNCAARPSCGPGRATTEARHARDVRRLSSALAIGRA